MKSSKKLLSQVTILFNKIFLVTFPTELLHLIRYIAENRAEWFAIVNSADCFTKKL